MTDSYSPVIYQVNEQGKAAVFIESDLFKGEDVGLNGIACSAKGYLLVANDRDGCLYKITIADKKITKVKIDHFFPGADGIMWDKDGGLVMVQNKGVDKVMKLMSKDNWASAELTAATAAGDRMQQPSALAMAGGQLYVLNSKMNELADPTKRPSKDFSIQLVELRSTK